MGIFLYKREDFSELESIEERMTKWGKYKSEKKWYKKKMPEWDKRMMMKGYIKDKGIEIREIAKEMGIKEISVRALLTTGITLEMAEAIERITGEDVRYLAMDDTRIE